jgi:DNA-binding MarR family transcriptional regulator
MGRSLTDLERQRLVSRRPDPADRRAVLVSFTESGLQFLTVAAVVTRELDAEYRALLGDRQMDNLLIALRALLTAADETTRKKVVSAVCAK